MHPKVKGSEERKSYSCGIFYTGLFNGSRDYNTAIIYLRVRVQRVYISIQQYIHLAYYYYYNNVHTLAISQ